MITNVSLKNYKSFSNVNADFTKGQEESSMIAIYGENGSGKTNLIETIIKLSESTRTIFTAERLEKVQEKISKEDAEGESLIRFLTNIRFKNTNISSVFKNTHTIGNQDDTEIKYSFSVHGQKGYYQLKFSQSGELIQEKLYSIIGSRSGLLYDITKENDETKAKISPSLIKGSLLRNELRKGIDKFWGTHTLLAIFADIQNKFNKNFVNEGVLDTFQNILDEFQSISYKDDNQMALINKNDGILTELDSGEIDIQQKPQIEKTAEVLNQFYPKLYTDIKKVKYSIVEKNEKLAYSLVFEKKISTEIIDIPFELESTGTKNLLDIFPLILLAIEGKTVIIDEIDSGIHDLLILKLVNNIYESITGQLIFTTHDTLLMQSINPDYLYVIQVDFQGRKKVVNISEASKTRLRDSNNIQKMYLKGYFSGIPYVTDVDFDEIIDTIGEQ